MVEETLCVAGRDKVFVEQIELCMKTYGECLFARSWQSCFRIRKKCGCADILPSIVELDTHRHPVGQIRCNAKPEANMPRPDI